MRSKTETEITLDQLRAGLSPENGDTIDIMNPALIQKHNDQWKDVVQSLEDNTETDRTINNQLRVRRRQVLNGEYPARASSFNGQWLIGAAASVTLAVSVFVWWNSLWDREDQFTAETSIQNNLESEEITTNIDFYTWLESQPDAVADAGGS